MPAARQRDLRASAAELPPFEGGVGSPTATFDGFISYSHAVDGRLAPALQTGFHRFAKPWYRLRALRVFRDETSLSATPERWPSIIDALDCSRWFILPRSRPLDDDRVPAGQPSPGRSPTLPAARSTSTPYTRP